MVFSVEHVKPLGDFKILVSFENHEERVFDVRPYLKLGIFQELKDPNPTFGSRLVENFLGLALFYNKQDIM